MVFRSIVFALLALLALPVAGAHAAPQILGVVATAAPVSLTCAGGMCSAQLSTFCLQRRRDNPYPGTAYSPIGGAGVTLVLTAGDGTHRRLAGAEYLDITAVRAYSAITVSLPEERLHALGAVAAAVEVGRDVSLLPHPVAGDPDPLTEREIAYVTGPLRTSATRLLQMETRNVAAARVTGRLINATPTAGRMSEDGRRGLWRRVMGTAPVAAGSPGVRRARDVFGACRVMTDQGHFFSLRRCLEQRHDGFMLDINTRYWRGIGAGS